MYVHVSIVFGTEFMEYVLSIYCVQPNLSHWLIIIFQLNCPNAWIHPANGVSNESKRYKTKRPYECDRQNASNDQQIGIKTN